MGPESRFKKSFERLPTYVVPKHYNIWLKPDLEKFTSVGVVTITVDVKESTDDITLNAVDMEILEASYKTSDGKVLPALTIAFEKKEERLYLCFTETIQPETNGQLKIEFKGTITDKMKGFYRSKYQSVEGQADSYAGVTHFEATNARMAYPSWDEPQIKATFEMKLTVDQSLVALFNTPVVNTTVNPDDPKLKDVKFGVTPVMSTYLTAWAVGHFDHVEGKTRAGIPVRIYTPIGKSDQGSFALEVAVKCLDFYTEYFGIPDPMAKMDLIAVADFPIGAMENWGLITYRETYLLFDPINSAAAKKQDISLVVAHELSHMWFGNLVTMEWWTHLWLKEGFASFMEYLASDHIFPDFHMWTQFVSDDLRIALELDALHNSHPIEVPVGHPSEIEEIFDAISYNKGASVIRMLHRYLDTDFRKGVSLYLKRHQYKNTVTENLWDALEEVSGKPVREVMSTWTKQKGYPVISVSQIQDGDSSRLTLSQEKFASDGNLSDSDKRCLWMTPVSIVSASSPTKSISDTLLVDREETIILDNFDPNDWIKLNQDSVGVYRVCYSRDMLIQLIPAIESKALSPVDRLNIQSDLYALAKSGWELSDNLLSVLRAYKNEDNYAVWSSIDSSLGRFNLILSNTEQQDAFHTYGRVLLSNIHQKMGWEPKKDEKHTDVLLRSLIISRLAGFNDPQVLEKAKQLFDAHVAKTSIIPADMRSAVYSSVAQNSDEKTFNSLLQLYRDTDLSEEKNRILRALGRVKDEGSQNRILDMSISPDVRSQDTFIPLASAATTKSGQEKVWRFFKANRKLFEERYAGPMINRIVKISTENFVSVEKASEVEEYFSKHPIPGTERSVQQSLEQIRINAAWLNRDLDDIKTFLTQK